MQHHDDHDGHGPVWLRLFLGGAPRWYKHAVLIVEALYGRTGHDLPVADQ